MAKESTLRFGAQTDEVTSLLRIVNMVRAGDASTRPEIGRVTGLGRGVVTQRVDQAIEMGYLEDGEFGPSSGGRAPRTLRFRSSRGRIIVCALGALHIHVGVAMLEGDILEQEHRAWDISRGPAETLDAAMAMIDVIRADEMSRLGTCDDEDCDGIVLDLSRNRSKRFCSTTCGNRNAVAAYRARQAGGD